MEMELNAAKTSVVISVSLGARVVVPVYTSDGIHFEASPRGIGDEVRDAAIGYARQHFRDHPDEWKKLKAQLKKR